MEKFLLKLVINGVALYAAVALLNGHGITLLPQLIWLAAPIVFYFISIEIRRGDLNRLVRS